MDTSTIKFFKEDLFEIPAEYKEQILQMRSWLKTQPHLPSLSDEHLLIFLHSCYSKMFWAKVTIENYFTARTHTPELFSNRSPRAPDVQAMLSLCNVVPLTERSPEGYKITLYRCVDPDPEKFHCVYAIKVFLMFIDVLLADDGLVPGRIVIFDMKGINMGHVKKVNFSAVRKFTHYIQDCNPVRLKAIHMINTVPIIDKLLAIFKPFLKQGVMPLLHFHHKLDTLEKFIPLHILPVEYGGEAESCHIAYYFWTEDETIRVSEIETSMNKAWIKIAETISSLAKFRERFEKEFPVWFEQQESLKVDESKRVGKKSTENNIYGMEGSFRKLDID